jgi:hypothetical protein
MMTVESPEYANSQNHDIDGDKLVVKLYDANKGKTPRTGGPYLDEVQAEQAEIQRAKVEGREPDLDNPGPTASTVLVPASQLTERDVDKSHYADTLAIENEPVTTYVADTSDPFLGEPDPRQADWDNDSDKIKALQGGVLMQELEAKNNTPDPEPKNDDYEV